MQLLPLCIIIKNYCLQVNSLLIMSNNTKSVFLVAAVQMSSHDKTEENLSKAEALIHHAANRGVKLAVLPEAFSCMSLDTQQKQMIGQQEITAEGSIRSALSSMAKKHNIHIVAGTLPVCDNPQDPRPYAACFFYDATGKEIARYNKMHLFNASVNDRLGEYKESAIYQPGNTVTVTDTVFGRIGFAVCYDLRFPEFFRILFQQHVDIIVLPSAFTKLTGAAHWLPLLQARAIENQCFIIAANQEGSNTDKNETYGHSTIISAWGEVLDIIKTGEGIAYAELDMAYLQNIRMNMPVREHQRFFIRYP